MRSLGIRARTGLVACLQHHAGASVGPEHRLPSRLAGSSFTHADLALGLSVEGGCASTCQDGFRKRTLRLSVASPSLARGWQSR